MQNKVLTKHVALPFKTTLRVQVCKDANVTTQWFQFRLYNIHRRILSFYTVRPLRKGLHIFYN
jgi:hypothetical protein